MRSRKILYVSVFLGAFAAGILGAVVFGAFMLPSFRAAVQREAGREAQSNIGQAQRGASEQDAAQSDDAANAPDSNAYDSYADSYQGAQEIPSLPNSAAGISSGIENPRGDAAGFFAANAAAQAVPLTPDEQINIRVYQQRNESVVNINTEILAYNWFFEPVLQEGDIGSGTIIDAKGYILTNYHVVEKANSLIVTLWNNEKRDGTVVGYDVENDLAVLKVDPKGLALTPIPFGDSGALRVGQKVLVIGNPFAFDRTLSTGIVSGLGRPIRNNKNIIIQNMIQTDASINPGNSGGPLLNAAGEMVGVNTIIYSPSSGSVGVGFAVPSQTAVRVVSDIIKFGKVQRGWIYWQVQPLFAELAKYAGLPVEKGLLVTAVQDGKNADKAGITGGRADKAVRYGRTVIYLGGDIITSINGTAVDSIAKLLEALERTKPGQEVQVEFYRGKKKQTVTVPLEERPENLQLD